jgi:hypothetical protein
LALSGGGIRSASFGLGVIQALLEHGVMQQMDYLSTVSGGGYIGASLTWFRHKFGEVDPSRPHQRFFGKAEPFGEKGRGVRSEDEAHPFLTYLRQHGCYLTPTRWLNLLSVVAVALRNLLISLFIYLALFIVVLSLLMVAEHWAAGKLSATPPLDQGVAIISRYVGPVAVETGGGEAASMSAESSLVDSYPWLGHSFFQVNALVATLLLTLLAFYGALFSLWTFLSPYLNHFDSLSSYTQRTSYQIVGGWLLKFAIMFLVLAALPGVLHWIESQGANPLIGAFGAVSGIWAAASKMRTFLGKQPLFQKMPWIGDRLFEAGALLFIFGMLVFSYKTGLLLGIPNTAGAPLEASIWTSLAWIGGLAVLFALFVNINTASLGRMYRDRLMEAFLPSDKAVRRNAWRYAFEANTGQLADMCLNADGTTRKPFHLINTNVILTNSKKEKYRRRGGDSFLLSPLFCGSYATGYVPTASFMTNRILRNAGMKLATAMAISGAAVNPFTGVAGRGPTRGVLVSMLMTIFNLRLGAWVTNPKDGAPVRMMNYFRPGLCSLLPIGHKEASSYLELTDGGHFENTGLYELVRRRVGTIILSDAGVDKNFRFGDLANAIEKVRTDFGVSIRFAPEQKQLGMLLPGSSPIADRLKDTDTLKKMSAAGYMIGMIKYPAAGGQPAFDGLLIVLKTVMIPDLPVDLYSYRANHEDFPDQPTSDQFFDEKQFEAYRELGYRVADSMYTGYLAIPPSMQQRKAKEDESRERGRPLEPSMATA